MVLFLAARHTGTERTVGSLRIRKAGKWEHDTVPAPQAEMRTSWSPVSIGTYSWGHLWSQTRVPGLGEKVAGHGKHLEHGMTLITYLLLQISVDHWGPAGRWCIWTLTFLECSQAQYRRWYGAYIWVIAPLPCLRSFSDILRDIRRSDEKVLQSLCGWIGCIHFGGRKVIIEELDLLPSSSSMSIIGQSGKTQLKIIIEVPRRA